MFNNVVDNKRIVNVLHASREAKNQWFKDYWYNVALKIAEKYT